jgi:hypothetical protein
MTPVSSAAELVAESSAAELVAESSAAELVASQVLPLLEEKDRFAWACTSHAHREGQIARGKLKYDEAKLHNERRLGDERRQNTQFRLAEERYKLKRSKRSQQSSSDFDDVIDLAGRWGSYVLCTTYSNPAITTTYCHYCLSGGTLAHLFKLSKVQYLCTHCGGGAAFSISPVPFQSPSRCNGFRNALARWLTRRAGRTTLLAMANYQVCLALQGTS